MDYANEIAALVDGAIADAYASGASDMRRNIVLFLRSRRLTNEADTIEKGLGYREQVRRMGL